DEDGPAHGQLKVGDVIVGIDDQPFDRDARMALADAINEAEKKANAGELTLSVFRDGKTTPVTITLPMMGSFSPTAPYRCEKTDRIIDQAVEYMKQNRQQLLTTNWIGYINGLGLMATGREDVMPLVRDLAYRGRLKDGEKLSVEKHVSMMSWRWAYRAVFLSEYYLRTQDRAVLPSIEELATKIAMGQSGAGTWGHTYAARENTGELHGHLGGYGALNQIGLTMQMALVLARECGVDNQEISDAIDRGNDFFAYFIGKGTIPYGDHGANWNWFDDNGKSAQAAVYFDLADKPEGSEFFSQMVLGSAPNGREEGHTGHFWSRLWGGAAVARGGEKMMQMYFDELNPYFTLERQPSGRFAFQDNVGESGSRGEAKTKWDSTGSRLLTLCVPRRAIRITGKDSDAETNLPEARLKEIVRRGHLAINKDARAELTEDEIFELLKDPLPPIRTIGARTLAERNLNRVDRLIKLLESDNRYARYGAARALQEAGFGDREAANKVIELMAKSDDLLFQLYAIRALTNRDKRRGLLNVARPAIPVLMKMALKHREDDPRRVLQSDISEALFYSGRAQPHRGLVVEYGMNTVPRDLLVPVMREIMVNDNGRARSHLSWLYPRLTEEEKNQLWPDIYRVTRDLAPSGIMFASGIRTSGLKMLAKNRIEEGLDLAVWYLKNQKGHGSRGRVPDALEAIMMYGAHAKWVVPQLEEHAQWYESKRRRGRIDKNDPANAIREAIKKINAMDDDAKPELRSLKDHAIELVDPGA
ncbi:MAG: DUF6288 domain-containing protein, partial [Phycisphaeraceae bacterium]|nr:DUF6288 domain-containing protein [Phycisphaeraceae bacterium]